MTRHVSRFVVVVLVAALVACSTSPTGRRQLTLFPSADMNRMGATAFEEIREQTPTEDNTEAVRYVECIADALLAQLGGREGRMNWEVVVFRDDAVNAFALPGGRIGVYTGLLDVAENQHQLAAVIGHEIGHVMAEHGNERMSTAFATNAGMQVVQILSDESSVRQQQALGLLGLGAQFGIILPFSRTQESEADEIGLELMARAGFDPRQSVDLWRNMAAAGGNAPPEFLSTHPSSATRIRDLQQLMPRAVRRYQEAGAQGRRPECE